MKGLIYFLSGVAVGAASTYLLLKGRYNASEKEFYARKYDERKPKEEEKEEQKVEEPKHTITEKPDIHEYARILAEQRYSNKDVKVENSHIISKREFEESEYDAEALIYYADGVLAYETTDEVVDNADEIVGTEFKDHFGEYEDNTVFVRNDEEQTDFEIIRYDQKYKEVSDNGSHGSEE